ncbi:MAG: 16S rRNA processing protein RimM [Chloroflexota bacterium]|nr:MAG: 16S rRNA processing protein RimM [Chloroflexota bacterium]
MTSPGKPSFLAVGRLRRPHGVRGEIMMDVLTDFPERLEPGVEVFVGPEHIPQRLKSLREHGMGLLVSFEDYHNPEEVGKLRNQIVYVSAANRPPLPEGEYYHHEVLGLRVVDETGDYLGTLTEIMETGANDVYIVQPDHGPEILIPVIEETVLDIDLQSGVIQLRVLPGLLPEE